MLRWNGGSRRLLIRTAFSRGDGLWEECDDVSETTSSAPAPDVSLLLNGRARLDVSSYGQGPGSGMIQGIPGLQPVYEDYARCVHCGLCLNHCPTYRLWQLEADSPRGRIFQMIRVKDGEAPVNATFVEHIDKCLDCRACETACPSGVEYGKLVEFARARIATEHRRPFFSRLARNFAYRWLLPRPARIAFFARLLKFYQRSGLQTLARKSGALRMMGLAEREALLPRVDNEFFFRRLGRTFPAAGQTRARVAFFGGCVAQVTFAELNEATIRVLTTNGCEVTVPRQQVCCGALMAHAGDREAARIVARRNLRAFGGDEFDAILTNAAGCGSTLKEYSHLFSPGEPEYEAATEFIASAGCDGVSGQAGAGGCLEGIPGEGDLPGFMPLVARPEGARGAAQIVEVRAGDRVCGVARFGDLLRIGRRVQLDGN